MTGDVTGSELAEISQQSHVSVMGCNMGNGHIISIKEVEGGCQGLLLYLSTQGHMI